MNMSSEEFNPSDEKFKKVEDLPKEHQKEFVDIEGGFVRKEAAENFSDAKFEAGILNAFRGGDIPFFRKDVTPLDVLQNKEKSRDKIREREELIKAVKRGDILSLGRASEEFRADREVVLEAVKQDGEALRYASNELRADREVVLEAVKQNLYAIKYASDELREKADKILKSSTPQ